MTTTENFFVTALPPFDFDLSSLIFSNGDEQIRRYQKGNFWQVIRIDNKLSLVSVKSVGTVEKPKLFAELKTDCKPTGKDKENALKAVSYLFNLDFDLAEFYEEIENDLTMARLTNKLVGLKNPTTQFAFEALIDSIVEQQISLKVAQSLERKIIKKLGDTLDLEGKIYYAYPTPRALSTVSFQEFRNLGLSERKAEYIRNIASLVSEGKLDLEMLKCSRSSDEIIEELDKIRGVGVWTAELTMLRGMARLEAFPADDLGLRRTISNYYCNGRPLTSANARDIAENWGKWKGLVAYYLIVAEILGIEK